MRICNTTALSTRRLTAMFQSCVDGWPHELLTVSIRYSRGADFSGTCNYEKKRIHVNIGRHVGFPYRAPTHLARARSNRTHWWKPVYAVELADGYQLVLFVFLHEFYHWLIKQAKRNIRQKESMCDRFAARALVAMYGVNVHDPDGGFVSRDQWDFQDLDRFVAAARAGRLRARRSA